MPRSLPLKCSGKAEQTQNQIKMSKRQKHIYRKSWSINQFKYSNIIQRNIFCIAALHWMARPIFVSETKTETEPLQSLTNETRPRLIPIESCKRDWDRDSFIFSLASKTETETQSQEVSLTRPRPRLIRWNLYSPHPRLRWWWFTLWHVINDLCAKLLLLLLYFLFFLKYLFLVEVYPKHYF